MRVTQPIALFSIALGILALAAASPLHAQDDPASPTEEGQTAGTGYDFGMDLGIGVQSYRNPDYDPVENPDVPKYIAYQSLRMTPELRIGQLGVGLDVTLNYTFTGGEDGDEFRVREKDWVPDDDTSFPELYLPKIRYVSWAQKGEPLYVRLGTLDRATLGNAFIVGGYTNTQHLPERRIFGGVLDVDGRLVGFPYVGIETVAANLTAWDVVAGRAYVRPFADFDLPIVPNIQFGATAAADFDPYYFEKRNEDSSFYQGEGLDNDEQVSIAGADIRAPLLNTSVVSLTGFGDVVRQKSGLGGMTGFGGQLIGFIDYGFQLRFVGDNFIPQYFDRSYDLYRHRRYQVYSGEAELPGYVGWLANAGVSFLDRQFVFNAEMQGPIGGPEDNGIDEDAAAARDLARNPALTMNLTMGEGLLGGFSVEGHYEKRNIKELEDLVSPEHAVIGGRVSYRTGPARVSLVYDLRYDPTAPGDDQWRVSSGLESSISLF